MSTLSSANVTDVNLVLKERTHMRLCINMLIFMHNLGNWLIITTAACIDLYSCVGSEHPHPHQTTVKISQKISPRTFPQTVHVNPRNIFPEHFFREHFYHNSPKMPEEHNSPWGDCCHVSFTKFFRMIFLHIDTLKTLPQKPVWKSAQTAYNLKLNIFWAQIHALQCMKKGLTKILGVGPLLPAVQTPLKSRPECFS